LRKVNKLSNIIQLLQDLTLDPTCSHPELSVQRVLQILVEFGDNPTTFLPLLIVRVTTSQTTKFSKAQNLIFKNREIDGPYLCLQQFDKF
jgi:hypothetical protein